MTRTWALLVLVMMGGCAHPRCRTVVVPFTYADGTVRDMTLTVCEPR